MNSTADMFFPLAQSVPAAAPPLPRPRRYRPKIGLIGCGNIAASHLEAYRVEGWEVAALCDLNSAAAHDRARTFYSEARIHADYRTLLEDPSIDVVDVALHPEHRLPVMDAALRSGKHVLSQKPFTLNFADARRLVALAKENGVRLAVNQNGRWAPYMSYLRHLCDGGFLGPLQSAQVHINWDHTWIHGMDFEKIHHIVFFDFAIHWIDLVRLCFGEQSARQVYATTRSTRDSSVRPPLLGAATIGFDNGVASLLFDGNATPGARESIVLTGRDGTVRAAGELHAADSIEVTTQLGEMKPNLSGRWYREGFRGAMGELLLAIEEDREPSNSAADNLKTLELLFAIVDSADSGEIRHPGEIEAVSDSCRIAR